MPRQQSPAVGLQRLVEHTLDTYEQDKRWAEDTQLHLRHAFDSVLQARLESAGFCVCYLFSLLRHKMLLESQSKQKLCSTHTAPITESESHLLCIL